MQKKLVSINGLTKMVLADPEASLADVLREQFGLTGTKVGCGQGQCGCCSVILDGKLVKSCMTKMKRVPDGASILTIEGIGTPDNLHPLQLAWTVHGGGSVRVLHARVSSSRPRRFWTKTAIPRESKSETGSRRTGTRAAAPVTNPSWTR